MARRDFTCRFGWLLCALLAALALPPQGRAQQAPPGETRPYSDDSAWNLKIGPQPAIDPDSERYIENLSGHFGANPDMYSTPVYLVDASTPMRTVTLSGWWSKVGDDNQTLNVERRVAVEVPIPDGALPATGKDSNIVLWNPRTGEEWGFWQATPLPSGDWMARNGYAYNTNWNAVPPEGFISRGAGIPYLAGVVRPWELRQGRIEHAIGFAVNYPSSDFVYPATKSDGEASPPSLPSGARLQLDPAMTEEDFRRWGLSQEGIVMARALQEYGMIVADGSGHPKLSVEFEGTARWGRLLDKDIVRAIPYTAFRVLDLGAPAQPEVPTEVHAESMPGGVQISWSAAAGANRYRVARRQFPSAQAVVIAREVKEPQLFDSTVEAGGNYSYTVMAVNHNGVSAPSTIAVVRVADATGSAEVAP